MRWRMNRTSYVMVLLALVLAAPLGAQQTGRITGRIVNAQTNRPLPGVQVFVPPTGIGNLTDADGRYLLQNVPPGQMVVTAQLVGYKQGEIQSVTGRGFVMSWACGNTSSDSSCATISTARIVVQSSWTGPSP